MSHTDKDRPLWVKRNDATLLRYTDHNHLLLDKPLTKRVYRLNAEGKRYTVTKTYKRVVFDFFAAEAAGYFDRNLSATERAEFKRVFRADLYHEVEDERNEWAYDEVPDGRSPATCTEGQPVTRATRWFYDYDLPCAPELTLDHGYGSEQRSRPGVQRVNRRLRNKTDRNRRRGVLTKYAKEVNALGSAELAEHFDDSAAPVTPRPAAGWWDWD